ncbi:MAG: cyclic nucleotide-binding domain-containing protein [Desulforhopalus sp.]|nr:cyclic nucleotide-binding domain-containing protein [Desulforhopalus sp.]
MDHIVQQEKKINVLKALNNAIMTSRLYPPEAPQVATAIERGYKGLKLFLREQGSLLFSFAGDTPCLCGNPLDQEILDSFANLVIYRTLRLLGLPQLTIGLEMDRFAFGQIISVFNSPIEKVKKQGGGIPYITNLGLASYFPEELEEKPTVATTSEPVSTPPKSRKVVKIRPELLACLYGMDKKPALQEELKQLLATTDSAVDLLAAGVAHVLQDIQKKGGGIPSQLFPLMMRGAEAGSDEKERRPIALGLARLLSDSLREPTMAVLLSQEYPDGFGTMLYEGLLGFLSAEKMGTIVGLFRQQIDKARAVGGDTSPQMKLLDDSLQRLLNTGKGKQYLGLEKARALIHEGEAVRRKRRLESGINALLQGNLGSLKSEELAQYLPEAVIAKIDAKEEKDAETLLQRTAAFLGDGSENIGKTLLGSVVTLGENFAAKGNFAFIDSFLEPLLAIVRSTAIDEAIMERLVVFLHQVMQASWSRGDNKRGDAILALFYMIRSGQVDKSAAVKGIVGKIQDKGIQRAKFPALLAAILAAPLDEAAGYRLVLQGPVAVRFLVETLINTDGSADRIKIIDLLTTNNAFLVPIIHERLPEHMPWYGKRNLLKLLGETGAEADAEKVLPYFRHEDFRVQREAFLCLYRIAGKSRKKLLLAALADSSELIMIQVIAALAGICDQEVATELSNLLTANDNFSDKNRADIVLQILDTLGRCTCWEAFKGVEDFMRLKGTRAGKKLNDAVWTAAAKALETLEYDLQEARKRHQQAGQLRKNALKQAAKLSKGAGSQRITTGLPQEQMVRTLLAQGNKGGARDLLVQLIEKSARARNFFQAESLREWLVEIDPNAFGSIIQAAEIIDREKMAAIDKSHLEIWSALYECLTSEEFSAVYYGQKHTKYQGEEIIVSQGSLQTSLFFINSGKVKLYFEDKGKEVLVKTMGSGEIFGAGAFFEASIWTISVACVSPSDISVLKLDKLQEWSEEFPGLESKLHDFCRKFEKIDEFIKKSSRDRRNQERFALAGRASTTLLDTSGQSIGVSAMAELADISIGGLSYTVRISKKENARLLLGRKVQVKLPAGEKSGEFVQIIGDILAVRSTYAVENDYSVHVRFDSKLKDRKVQEIIKAAHRENTSK